MIKIDRFTDRPNVYHDGYRDSTLNVRNAKTVSAPELHTRSEILR